MIKKIAPLFFFFVFFFFLLPGKIYAQDDFYIDSNSNYKVTGDNNTIVSQNITITNRKEFVYSPSYSITLHFQNISDVSAVGESGAIPFTEKDGALGAKTYTINFPDKIVGLNKKNSFVFSYKTSDLAVQSGDIWHVTIPGTADPAEFSNYQVTLSVPSRFGNPSIVKPPQSYDISGNSLIFNKSALTEGGIELYFGSPQVYKFTLNYHLENKNPFPITTEIALPPVTSYQDVIIQNITPPPTSVYQDSDGNWLARYNLGPKTSYAVSATVLIKVSNNPSPQPLSDTQRGEDTKSDKYWESSDPEIQKIAKTLTTPEQIYNYVVKTLSYSNSKTQDNNVRLGAKKVLTQPYFAVCLEFSDLFVALARANGIPARIVEGYGYTEGQSTKPLSLSDTLHAWPEYYDETLHTWVMVDPTWGNTTQGVDFFHQLDFDHVAFVINGKDSTYPIPAGGYKVSQDTKDIDVSFATPNDFQKTQGLKISGNFSSFLNNGAINGVINVQNTGNSNLSTYDIFVQTDNGGKTKVAVTNLPPYGTENIAVMLPLAKSANPLFLTNISHTITITDAKGKVLYQKNVKAFPFSILILLGGAILIAAGIVFIIAIKTRGVSVQRPE